MTVYVLSLTKSLYDNLEDQVLIWDFRPFRALCQNILDGGELVLSTPLSPCSSCHQPPPGVYVCMCGVAPAPAAKLGHPPSPGVWVLLEWLGPVSGGGILGRGPAETQSVAQKEALSAGLT